MTQKIKILFIGLCLVSAILASPAHARGTKKSKKGDIPLHALIQKALAEGYETYIPDIKGSLIDLPGDMAAQEFSVLAGSTTDNMSHDFLLVVDESTSAPAMIPLKLIFMTTQLWPVDDEQYLFKSSLSAFLEKVILISGKHSLDGKDVKGSGVYSEKDIESPEIKERFQHELDFWLKGKYRKPEVKSGS